jgi:hypothetical protein
MPTITLHSYRVHDELTRKWRIARYKMTPDHAKAVYGEANYELLAGSAVTYEGEDPTRHSAAHLAGPRRNGIT